MKNNTKEFYDLMTSFEKSIKTGKLYLTSYRLDKEDRVEWAGGHYYQNGEVNNTFVSFVHGYQMAKAMAKTDGLPLDE